MKKFGILLLAIAIIASAFSGCIGEKGYETGAASINDFFKISSEFSDAPPVGIEVSDSSPFYALIATPLAVHYNDGEREVIPLYVKNLTNPSSAIVRAQEQIEEPDLEIPMEGPSVKENSLSIAKKYWKNSDGVMIIKDDQWGYELGIVAVPMASYFGIPVIVTDKMDKEVANVLKGLGVKYSIVCGDIEGYGKTLKFKNVDEVLDSSIKVVKEKFGNVSYVTLANPIDAWPPEVLNRTEKKVGPVTLQTMATTQLFSALNTFLKYGMGSIIGNFTIPEDYKYALVKFEGINLDCEDVDELGDDVAFYVGPNCTDLPEDLQKFEVCAGSTSAGGIPIRDSSGKIIKDRLYTEAVLYDRGGIEYNIRAGGTWLAKKEGKVEANIVIEKLSDPLYPMMKSISSIAPYLTAYHKGILFAKPDFAFAADDDVLVDGKNCPGFWMPRRNPKLVKASNDHVWKIHEALNQLLVNISGISDLEELRDYYKENPIYIALVGGATVLPQAIYDSYIAPVDVDECPYYFGCGTPSDFIYGNIDPLHRDWSNTANDTYSYYPYQENVVGRITGWDVQDASALIDRTIFYDKIIAKLGDWKDNAALLIGGGQDFQKPLLRYLIFGDLLGLTPRGEPMKFPTGYGKFAAERTKEKVYEPMDFTINEAYAEEAARQGFSDEAIDRLKKATWLNRLAFSKRQLKNLIGEEEVKGGELMENSNFIWANAHGNQHLFGMEGIDLVSAGIGGPIIHGALNQILPIVGGGFMGPGTALMKHVEYSTREVENMDLGPSFLWIESCICGKIDGMYPQVNIGQTCLHAGINALIAAPTESNIAGGYLDPKIAMYDVPLSVWLAYLNTSINAKRGGYPDPHFGYKIYADLCEDLRENDSSIGLALRNARNKYLPEDANWTLWWSPPLIITGNPWYDYEIAQKWSPMAKNMLKNGKSPLLRNKYISFQEYTLFGDPAFNPYEPCNRG